MSEWYASLECKRCNRKSYKYFRGKLNKQILVGCNECGQSTTTKLTTQTITGPDIKITIDIPYFDD